MGLGKRIKAHLAAACARVVFVNHDDLCAGCARVAQLGGERLAFNSTEGLAVQVQQEPRRMEVAVIKEAQDVLVILFDSSPFGGRACHLEPNHTRLQPRRDRLCARVV